MWYAMLLRVQPYLITFLFSKSQYIKNNPIKRMVVLLQPHIKTFTSFSLYSSIQPLCGHRVTHVLLLLCMCIWIV